MPNHKSVLKGGGSKREKNTPLTLPAEEWFFGRVRSEELLECALYEYAREIGKTSPHFRSLVEKLGSIPRNYTGGHCGTESALWECGMFLRPRIGVPLLHRDMISMPWLLLSKNVREKQLQFASKRREFRTSVVKNGKLIDEGKGLEMSWRKGESVSGFKRDFEFFTTPLGRDMSGRVFGAFVVDLHEPDTNIQKRFEFMLRLLRKQTGITASNSKRGKRQMATNAAKGLDALGFVRMKRSGMRYSEIEKTISRNGGQPPSAAEVSVSQRQTYPTVLREFYAGDFRNFTEVERD